MPNFFSNPGQAISGGISDAYQQSGIQKTLPQYSTRRPWQIAFGGRNSKFDLRDPRMLASLAFPTLGLTPLPYQAAGEQYEGARSDERLEQRSQIGQITARNRAAQQAYQLGIGGGGVQSTMQQLALEEVLALLSAQKRQARSENEQAYSSFNLF